MLESDAPHTSDLGKANCRVHATTEASLMMGVVLIILKPPQVLASEGKEVVRLKGGCGAMSCDYHKEMGR